MTIINPESGSKSGSKLESGSESLPTAAQIPLQTFHLPTFPIEATALKHLTLTSDIKPTEYADLLRTPLASDAIPPTLPPGIESLTLELFALGYPAPFLKSLGNALPNLKDLTLYAHLIDGVSESSRLDAVEFIRRALTGPLETYSNNVSGNGNGGGGGGNGLRELHLLDVFCRKGFISGLSDILHGRGLKNKEGGDHHQPFQPALRFLEVSYTYRGHSDGAFLARVPVEELPGLLVDGLVGVSLRLDAATRNTSSSASASASTGLQGIPDDPADVDENGDAVKKPEGIVPVGSGHEGTGMVVERLTTSEGEGESGLRMLDCTLYTLSLEQLARVLRRQQRLAVLSVSVLIPVGTADAKQKLLQTLRLGGSELEIVEVVGVPERETKDIAHSINGEDLNLSRDVFPSQEDLLQLTTGLPRLESFSISILRAPAFGSVSWVRRDDVWVESTARS
ncbi:hypothetical protein BDV26DRAFT_275730 [Aspergillus bertholletiae]|uniref:Uncharacterized protein n=1 Tax=Aspergillus bertholletiae TaxID=1226010 RepID=A0A5N7AP31_9EURO|nr:hypothetical protein BDV26DRAFT_275730 [Aspergillus bertholletiae]